MGKLAVLPWIQRPLEAGISTLIGAAVFYWFAPIVPMRRSQSVDVDALAYMVVGAILGACCYVGYRVFEAAKQEFNHP